MAKAGRTGLGNWDAKKGDEVVQLIQPAGGRPCFHKTV